MCVITSSYTYVNQLEEMVSFSVDIKIKEAEMASHVTSSHYHMADVVIK